MLNIQFTVEDGNEAQARGVVAALYAIYGDKVLPAVTTRTERVGDISVTVSTTQSGPDAHSKMEMVKDAIRAEVDAATAFAGNTAEYLAVHAPEPDAAAAFGGSAPTTAPTGDVTRDKAGIPWDERIHSSSKEFSQTGIWKRRRNTPDATFDAVMAELKAANTSRTMEAAAGIIPPPPPPASNVPAPPTTSPAPSPTPAAPAASSTAQGATDFPSIMRKVTGLQAAGKINPEQVANLLTSVGANPPSVSSLHRDAGLIPAFEALLDDHVAMQG